MALNVQNGLKINTVGMKNKWISCESMIWTVGSHVIESTSQYAGGERLNETYRNNSAAIADMVTLENVLLNQEMYDDLALLYRNTHSNKVILAESSDGRFKGYIQIKAMPAWAPATKVNVEFAVSGKNLVSKI